jgi:hypothetical protein
MAILHREDDSYMKHFAARNTRAQKTARSAPSGVDRAARNLFSALVSVLYSCAD